MMTIYVEVLVFGALLGLPFLYETRPAFCYCLKFSLYCIIVMINSVILIPVFLLRPRNILNLVLASYFCRWITHILGVKWIIRNGERLEPQKPCIVVCNHQSSLDILGMFQIWSTMKKCTVIARNEVFWVWPFGLAAWLAGLIFIPRIKTESDKAKTVIKQAVDKITEQNAKLWIFPEGTRRNTGEIHSFKKGAFHSAINAQLPVIPVVFSRYYFLNRPNKIFDQGIVIIRVLEPISTTGLTLKDLDNFTKTVHETMSQVFKEINNESFNHLQSARERSLLNNSVLK